MSVLSFFRRGSKSPDPRDGEYASAIMDDGTIDPAWHAAHTNEIRLPTGTVIGSEFERFPTLATPNAVELLREETELPEHLIRTFAAEAPADQRRYPQLWARLIQTGG